MRILLVCLGNICRSPAAEAAIREALVDAGLGDVTVDSAGTGNWHVGDPPDPRMTAAAADQGLKLTGTARQVTTEELASHDLILAMDRQNLRTLQALAGDPATRSRIRLFREYDPDADGDEVPDPYGGGAEGFARVVDIARSTADGVVTAIQRQRELGTSEVLPADGGSAPRRGRLGRLRWR